MGKRLGVGDYQYEAVEDWASIEIPGIASDVATDSEDHVYVATRTSTSFDNRSGAILVFDRNGKFIKEFGGDKLVSPHHIWISPEDQIYLTDNLDHVIRQYNPAGELLQIIGTPGQPGLPDKPFNQPTCAVLAPGSGDLYVSDGYRQSRCHRMSPDGELKVSWGSGDWHEYDFTIFGYDPAPGVSPGEFKLPHGITVDKNDRVYVMDRENNRIQVFDENGGYLFEWSSPGPNQGFIDENDVMHSASGRTPIDRTSGGHIRLNKLDGELIGVWGERGPASWQFTGGPHGLWIDAHGDVYVGQVGEQNGLNKYART
ncbi:MAG: peptidyl-alpha-hydroxyglycine alpha-amidating lyase family protein [SAR202 cluster bacterium]|jgi:DNA-binding beta-propeller fold protein YncE|nr:peptidyl-alpha-hydroxyglycine alpha-amidating lyase family protein [SAR202 cluster bacterium]